jgi:outer membrane biosynthesis protein TonB
MISPAAAVATRPSVPSMFTPVVTPIPEPVQPPAAVAAGPADAAAGSTIALRAPVTAAAPAAAAPQLAHAVVERVASEHTRELARCDGEDGLHGEIAVTFAVDTSGKVTKAVAGTGINQPKITACILRAIQGWQFPRQAAISTQGTYTLSFQ